MIRNIIWDIDGAILSQYKGEIVTIMFKFSHNIIS